MGSIKLLESNIQTDRMIRNEKELMLYMDKLSGSNTTIIRTQMPRFINGEITKEEFWYEINNRQGPIYYNRKFGSHNTEKTKHHVQYVGIYDKIGGPTDRSFDIIGTPSGSGITRRIVYYDREIPRRGIYFDNIVHILYGKPSGIRLPYNIELKYINRLTFVYKTNVWLKNKDNTELRNFIQPFLTKGMINNIQDIRQNSIIPLKSKTLDLTKLPNPTYQQTTNIYDYIVTSTYDITIIDEQKYSKNSSDYYLGFIIDGNVDRNKYPNFTPESGIEIEVMSIFGYS